MEEDNNKMVIDGKIINQLNLIFEQTKFGGINQFTIIDITFILMFKNCI